MGLLIMDPCVHIAAEGLAVSVCTRWILPRPFKESGSS